MKIERLSVTLLSIFIIVALMTPIVTISNLSVGTVSAASEIVIRGSITSYTVNQDPYPPQKVYNRGDNAILMVAQKGGNSGAGTVIAAGLASSLRNTRWDAGNNLWAKLDVLLDNAFQWATGKSPSNIKILWCDQTQDPPLGYHVYNTSGSCTTMRDQLRAWGYTVDSGTNLLSATNLALYDVLLIPTFELGSAGSGGDPSQLLDSDVAIIRNFVYDNGKTLIIFDGNDTFGYNYCKVSNKILKGIWGSTGYFFQSDTVQDDDNNYGGNNYQIYATVDNITSIGNFYQHSSYNPTQGTTIGLYSPCSLAPKLDWDVGVNAAPIENIEGLPGGKLVYTVNIANLGWNDDNFDLSVSDNVWGATFGQTTFTIPTDGGASTTLTVVIPTSAQFGDNDRMQITIASHEGHSTRSENINPRASSRVYTTYDDAQVSSADTTAHFANYLWMWVCSTNTPYSVLAEPHQNLYCYIKFDLRGVPSTIPPGNWTKDNVRVMLYAYCWGLHMTAGENVLCYTVDNDNWTEATICWDNKPAVGYNIDNARVVSDYNWCYWDVTNYIRSQLGAGDNFASFCLKANRDNLPSENNQDFGVEFYPKESIYPLEYPYLAIGYRVNTWITPDNAKGRRGGTVSYSVKVQNMGSFAENYSISVVDNTKPWTTSLSSTKINLQPGKIGTVDLNVTIPGNAPLTDNDNVLIRVVSDNNPAENDNYYCITYVSDNRIGPAKEDTAAKSQLRLENRVYGRDVYEFGPGHMIYTALPGYNYLAAPAHAWIKFDLRGIGTTTIARVTLNLYCRTVVGRGTPMQGARVQVYSVQNDNWSEDNLCWNNMPSTDNLLDTRNVPYDNAWYSWDVTNFIISQRSTDNIASFCLVDLGENVGDNCGATFVVKESSIASDNWPYLSVENTGQLPARDVRVNIDPIFQGGSMNGVTDNFTITVVNQGTSSDTYTLDNKDNNGWSLSLDSASLGPIPAGENRQTTLHVQIPSGSMGTIDNITVTATGTGVSDNAGCFAYRGKANLPGLGMVVAGALYSAQVDTQFLVGSGEILVAKFYDYGNTFESENVIWSGGTEIYIENFAVGHPSTGSSPVPKAVKRVDLVLRSGASERVIASFTVHQSNLRGRITKILVSWGANPGLQSAFRGEITDILKQWGSAPT